MAPHSLHVLPCVCARQFAVKQTHNKISTIPITPGATPPPPPVLVKMFFRFAVTVKFCREEHDTMVNSDNNDINIRMSNTHTVNKLS